MATIAITSLPSATAAATTDVLPIVQGGTTKQVTNALLFTNATLVTPTLGVATATSVTATGAIVSTGTAGVGYATGAGGTIVQGSSRTTGVTLNKRCGTITMFSAAGSATAATFTVTNSTVGANDVIILNQASGTNLYDLMVTAVSAGSFNITFLTTGGTATDAPVINFAVIDGVAV
jgi:hypothetical protein